MTNEKTGMLCRLFLLLEREVQLEGKDIQAPITKIIEILKNQPKEKL